MCLTVEAALAEQLSATFVGVEQYLKEFDPDAVLVLGDTNSGLSAVICERLGYPVFHMEAGNRCYDDRVPEEKNRRIIDHVSSVNLPYTELSRQNLLREGLATIVSWSLAIPYVKCWTTTAVPYNTATY
jgi:UDP-N-acetylglucosamine 2-epimerase (non-hydrolysing)